MNIANLSLNSIRTSFFEFSKRQNLNHLQYKILIVSSAILAGLAMYYMIKRCFFQHKHVQVIEPLNVQQTQNQPLTSSINSRTQYTHLNGLQHNSQHISSQVNEDAFKKHLMIRGQTANRVLLANTVLQAKLEDKPIPYHNFSLDDIEIQQLLQKTPENYPSKVTIVFEWFDYQDENHFYIDFAHSKAFGGAYNTHGCVQEERMFAEFRALPILDFQTKNGIHPCQDSEQYPPLVKPTPFIVESIRRQFDISQVPYGTAFHKTTSDKIIQGIQKVENPVAVNIIGLAAVDWRGVKKRAYTLKDLIYHFEAAYVANKGAQQLKDQNQWDETVIHTAPWGCGVFGNSEKMMVAIQYLAAKCAQVDIVFHGVGQKMNPNYSQEDVNQVIELIDQLIQASRDIQQILEHLLNKSFNDATWAPKAK